MDPVSMSSTLYAAQLIVLGVLSITVTVLLFRLTHWKEMFYEKTDLCETLLDRAVEAETEKSRVQSEMEFQKRTLGALANSLNNKEFVAVLNDHQVQHIVGALSQVIASSQTKPSEMN